jgi:hypothetical protein
VAEESFSGLPQEEIPPGDRSDRLFGGLRRCLLSDLGGCHIEEFFKLSVYGMVLMQDPRELCLKSKNHHDKEHMVSRFRTSFSRRDGTFLPLDHHQDHDESPLFLENCTYSQDVS